MDVLVVRHGHAGSKQEWDGDDRARPLSARGASEAAAVADVVAAYLPRRVVSSPYLRCLQTVEPLARRLGLVVKESALLVPDAGRRAAAFVRGLARLGGGPVVVCTHGETIEALQRLVVAPTALPFGPGSPHEKGSTWVLQVQDGRVTGAEYLPPAAEQRGAVPAGRPQPLSSARR